MFASLTASLVAVIERHGLVAVILGRWVGVLRALVPAVAGVARMPYRRFLLANTAGGVSWALVVSLLGHGAGTAWPQVEAWLGRGGDDGRGSTSGVPGDPALAEAGR
ncbi:DedA family protein [Georgenia sp. SYP-B2076]|uniref:DedA family protein n=1 Tax=Georgenia sp. SYP-B2076 TaxID=2495881 RepID=UPI0013E0BFBC|nr:VTT domain-containing protein [Georgenia sp. SYP-B2076]